MVQFGYGDNCDWIKYWCQNRQLASRLEEMWWKWQILVAVAVQCVHAMTGDKVVDTGNQNGMTCEEYVITRDELDVM